MKIHPYLTLIQGQKEGLSRRVERKPAMEPNEGSGASVVPRSETTDLVKRLSLENQRASAPTTPGDLNEAEQVLQRVRDDLAGLTKNELRGLHRLEGLVHVFSL